MRKTVFITGATAGLGEAMTHRYAAEGWRVIAAGRRQDRLQELQRALDAPVLPLVFDVRNRQACQDAVAGLPDEFSCIDVLVNNAGLALDLSPAHQADLDDWDVMVDTNVKGLLALTRAALPAMVERNAGHIVNIGSIAGTYPYPGGNVYAATKAFVNHFSRNLRSDLHGTGVRVSNIEPGIVETEFSLVRFKGDPDAAADVYRNTTPLAADDIAEIVYWTTALPPHVNVNAIEVMPTDQSWGPFAIKREE